jgi:alpha/beta superfamily hydrolase
LVTRGQYLERPALIPLGTEVLEGLWHRGRKVPPLLVVPPPPDQGSMDHVVCAELAWAAARAGHPVLRFNFRGVGASQGERGSASSRVADARAALSLLQENVHQEQVALAAVGASAQTALELAASHAGVVGLALISPGGGLELTSLPVPLLCVVGDEEPGSEPLSAALASVGGRLVVIPEADARFHRNLALVGRAVLGWLPGAPKHPDS